VHLIGEQSRGHDEDHGEDRQDNPGHLPPTANRRAGPGEWFPLQARLVRLITVVTVV
jgi:hypothetical protein